MATVTAIPKFERFFREVAEIDVDKSDLRRYGDFVNQVLYDLLIRAQATAHANVRDVIEPTDLPIAKGLHDCIEQFRTLDANLQLQPVLDALTNRPPLDLAYSDELVAQLPRIAGGISVALARSFKLIDPKVKNPASPEWERSFRLFQLLL
jgi:hypothetical protein